MRKKNISEEDIHSASAGFYEVLLGGATWQTAMTQVLPLADGSTSHMFLLDIARNQVDNLGIAAPLAEEALDAYTRYYGQFDPHGQYVAKQRVGTLIRCQEICDDRYVRHSEIFQDLLIPYGCRYTMGGIAAKRGSISAIVGIMRPTETGAFGEIERKRLQIIVNHVGNAVRLHWRLQGLERKLFAQAQALDALSFGVLVCNGYGHVYHANHEAEQILRRINAIKMNQGGLRCGLSLDQTRLDQLLRSVVQHGISNGMRVRDATTRQEWHLWAVPARDGLGFANERLAVIVITNPNQPPSLDMILQRVFGFTFAEVKLATALAAGCTVADYAERECISIAAARTHVRSILGKAGVSRQTDFLRMVANAGLITVKSG